MKQNSVLSFFKGLHMHNKQKYEISNHLKENTFKLCCLIVIHKKIFSHEEICFNNLQPLFMLYIL